MLLIMIRTSWLRQLRSLSHSLIQYPFNQPRLIEKPTQDILLTNRQLSSFMSCTPALKCGISYQLLVPTMGDSITEGTLSEWRKHEGDFVCEDDVVCVIETDKVSVDVHSDKSGKIESHNSKIGETVFVGTPLLKLQLLESQTTPDVSISSTKSKYQPSILFNRQKSSIHPSQSPITQPSTKTDLLHAEISTKKTHSPMQNIVKQFQDYSELPACYKPKPLSEHEIELVNSGGVHDALEKEAGCWKMEVVFVKNQSLSTSKTA